MAFNFLERLGTMFGKRVAERVLDRPEQAAEQAPPATEAPPADAVTEAPSAEAPPAEPEVISTVEEAPAEAQPTEAVAVPDPAPEPVAAEAPAEPMKSAEELEEERLWAETDAAWAAGDFQKVTESLDALKLLQPEDAAEIDEKIAAAQFNQAAAFEQSGDLERALYLFREAQRRNPNLGEASFAVERIQAQLQPPAPPTEPEAAPPAEQSYTVESGDSLWAIAERHYGDGSQWSRIFEANRDQLDNPDLIQPGQVLRIPT